MPFIAFGIGYFVCDYILHKSDVQTPNVIGKPVNDAVALLSAHSLSMRLLGTREDASLPEGIVLDQLPSPLQKIKTNQSVFVTVSTRRKVCTMANYWGQKQADVLADLAQKGLEAEVVYIASDYPQTMCIAQYPSPECPITAKKVLIYISNGKHPLGIMPNIIGCSLADVQDSYKKSNVRFEVFHTPYVDAEHDCVECIVTDQMPSPGSILDTSKGMRIQVQVAPR